MEAESLNVTAENNASVFSAQPLSIGVATANYFRSIKEWSNDTVQHYYSIDIAYPYNLHIYAKKMQEGRMSMILLDADERQIGRTMYCNDNIIGRYHSVYYGIFFKKRIPLWQFCGYSERFQHWLYTLAL